MVTTAAMTERVMVAAISKVLSSSHRESEESRSDIPKQRYLHVGQLMLAKSSDYRADDCSGRQRIQISGEAFFLFLIERHAPL